MKTKFFTACGIGGLLLLLWLPLLHLPHAGSFSIDGSYMYALSDFWLRDLQAGVDYVFTYGPYGLFFLATHFQPSLFPGLMLWAVGMALLFTLLTLMWRTQLASRLEQVLFVLLIALVLSQDDFLNALYHCMILMAALLALSPPTCCASQFKQTAAVVILVLWFALLTLSKFSFALPIWLSLIGIAAAWGLRGARHNAGLLIAGYLASLILLWLLAGQRLANLPTFLFNSLVMSAGFDSAMFIHGYGSLPADLLPELLLALVILALFGVIMLGMLIKQGMSAPLLIRCGILGFGLFSAWKLSFIRHDAHAVSFFAITSCLAFLLPLPAQHWRRWALLALLILPSLLGLFGSAAQHGVPAQFVSQWFDKTWRQAQTLLALADYRADLDAQVALLKQRYALPNIKQRVGNASIDVFPPIQALALLNELNYQPRPVFQGYQAYGRLLALNTAHYFAQASAPEFVLFELKPLDSRLPTLEDAGVIQALLRDYQPILTEYQFVLLQRRPRPELGITDSTQQHLDFGDNLTLANTSPASFISIDLQPSGAGKLLTLLYTAPQVTIHLTTTAGHEYRYTLIPSMASTPLLISPLLHSQQDWLAWARGETVEKVAALRIELAKPEYADLFQTPFAVRILASNIQP